MAQREVVFEMENGKNSGVDQIVLYLGEGVNARIKKEVKLKKEVKQEKIDKLKKWKRKGKAEKWNRRRKIKGKSINIVEIEIFDEETGGKKKKVEVTIKIENYEFVFKIEEGLNFETKGECKKAILANASKPEEL